MLAHRHRHPQDRSPNRGERGDTLIEVLMTIMLMGTAIAAVLLALFTLTKTSVLNRRTTHAAVTAQSYAEMLKQPVEEITQQLAYVACADVGTYQSFDGVLPTTYVANIDKVLYWNPITSTFTGTCYTPPPPADPDPNAHVRDGGLQQIWLSVESSDTPTVEETLVVVKRDARCPVDFDNADLGPC